MKTRFTTMTSDDAAGTRSSAASDGEPGATDAHRRRARRELATTVLVALALAVSAWLVGPAEADDDVVDDLHGPSTVHDSEATVDTAAGEPMGLLSRQSHVWSIGTNASELTSGAQLAFVAGVPGYRDEHANASIVGLGWDAGSGWPRCKLLLCCLLRPDRCR